MSHHQHDREEDRTLKEILKTEKEQLEVEEESLGVLRRIEHELHPHHLPASFRLTQENSTMAILGIIPGSTGTFTVTPLDTAGNPIDPSTLPAGYAPLVTSSDPANAPVASTDAFDFAVSVAAGATGSGITLTISNPDGSGATAFTVPYDAAPPPPPVLPASFGLTQNS